MENKRKIALVTGASRGLGKNSAIQIAKKGIDVIITYKTKSDEAKAVVEEIKALGVNATHLQLDVGATAGFETFRSRLLETLNEFDLTSIDFLINNAGIGISSPFDSMTEQHFDELYHVHFKGVYFLTQALLPLIANGGAIVNLSTGLARFSNPGYSAYASMKGAVEVLTRYLAKELGPRKIRANIVAPGAIDTDFTRPVLDARPEIREYITAQTALGRVGQPDDIGGIVAFLCTEEARWINGQRLEASGGIHL